MRVEYREYNAIVMGVSHRVLRWRDFREDYRQKMKKTIGWILFVSGIFIMLTMHLFIGYGLSFLIGFLAGTGGWVLAHPKQT